MRRGATLRNVPNQLAKLRFYLERLKDRVNISEGQGDEPVKVALVLGIAQSPQNGGHLQEVLDVPRQVIRYGQ